MPRMTEARLGSIEYERTHLRIPDYWQLVVGELIAEVRACWKDLSDFTSLKTIHATKPKAASPKGKGSPRMSRSNPGRFTTQEPPSSETAGCDKCQGGWIVSPVLLNGMPVARRFPCSCHLDRIRKQLDEDARRKFASEKE